MSAAANMAGLFPPLSDNEIWNEDLLWQPIPIHTIPTDMDYALFGGKPCPLYDRTMEEYLKSREIVALSIKYERMFGYLQENSGMEISTFNDAKRLYNILWIEQLKNKR